MIEVIGRAYELLARADALGRPLRGQAMPFGVVAPESRRWRASKDVRDRLTPAVSLAGVHVGLYEDRLLGIHLDVDSTLPVDSLILEDR